MALRRVDLLNNPTESEVTFQLIQHCARGNRADSRGFYFERGEVREVEEEKCLNREDIRKDFQILFKSSSVSFLPPSLLRFFHFQPSLESML